MSNKIALAAVRAELKYVTAHLPHRAWHAAGPILTCAWMYYDDTFDALTFPTGALASLICSGIIAVQYEKQKNLLIKCAKLEVKKD